MKKRPTKGTSPVSIPMPEWADPERREVTGELVGGNKRTGVVGVDPKVWALFIGEMSAGKNLTESIKRSGLTRAQLNGAVRTDAKARQEYEDAKLASAWTHWDMETVEDVLEAIMCNEDGGHLNRILESRGLASHNFYRLMMRDTSVKELYEEARQIQAEVSADDMQAIADDGLNDTYIDDKGRRRVDQDVVQRSRLRVDTMKWRLAKLHWKRFGDRIQQDQNVNLNVNHAERLEAGRKRLEELHKKRGNTTK